MDNQKKKKVIIGATTIAVIILMTGGIATGIAFNRNEAIKKANMQEVRKILDESEIQDNEDFVSMTLNLERTCIYEDNLILGENITIEEDIKEIIEEINLKEVIINDNTDNKH